MESSGEKIMGPEGFLWVWIMGDEISEHSITFAGFVLLGRCLPAPYCTECYGFKRMKEEQGLLIQQNKIMDAARIEPMTSR
jgi:hypothetical protein